MSDCFSASEMRRILLLIPSMSSIGGTERMVHSLSILLSSMGYEVHQASFDSPSTPRQFESKTPFHGLGPLPRLPLFLRPLTYAFYVVRLRRLKNRLGTQITISNLWGADFISVLSGGSDRKIALCHTNILGNISNQLMVRFLPLVSEIYKRFDKVIAVSESLASELKALYRLQESKIGYIHNFMDRSDAINCLPDDGRLRFVWCGRFSPEKNLPGLLHAWAEVLKLRPEMQLLLLGDGPLQQDIERLADKLGLSRSTDLTAPLAQVVFVGRVQNPASYLLGAQAMLLSSVAEGLPMVILEALSLGTPVLASDCMSGGVRSALQGSGICQPDRSIAEKTPAGCLLPVPDPAIPQSLLIWRDIVLMTTEDNTLFNQWRQGALARAEQFSSAAAMLKWKKVLTFGESTA